MAVHPICSVPDCGKKVFSGGWCVTHYHKLRDVPPCTIDGCDRNSRSLGLCDMHYKRLKRNGDVGSVRRMANGTYQSWLQENARHRGADCLIWPFSRDKHGYGPIREMCILAHGQPPTPDHQAAHSCGKGHEGCIHPKHLRWASRVENQADMIEHGNSQRGTVNRNHKLSDDEVRTIRIMADQSTQASIAKLYRVSTSTISAIVQRKRWAWLT